MFSERKFSSVQTEHEAAAVIHYPFNNSDPSISQPMLHTFQCKEDFISAQGKKRKLFLLIYLSFRESMVGTGDEKYLFTRCQNSTVRPEIARGKSGHHRAKSIFFLFSVLSRYFFFSFSLLSDKELRKGGAEWYFGMKFVKHVVYGYT